MSHLPFSDSDRTWSVPSALLAPVVIRAWGLSASSHTSQFFFFFFLIFVLFFLRGKSTERTSIHRVAPQIGSHPNCLSKHLPQIHALKYLFNALHKSWCLRMLIAVAFPITKLETEGGIMAGQAAAWETRIPCGRRFESQMLQCQSSFLLKAWENPQRMAQVLGLLLATWGTWVELLAPVFSLVQS